MGSTARRPCLLEPSHAQSHVRLSRRVAPPSLKTKGRPPMARMTINGIGIDYELLGDAGAPPAVITPGGRFPRDTPGVPELAAELVKGGKRVLLWDRPNCGA